MFGNDQSADRQPSTSVPPALEVLFGPASVARVAAAGRELAASAAAGSDPEAVVPSFSSLGRRHARAATLAKLAVRAAAKAWAADNDGGGGGGGGRSHVAAMGPDAAVLAWFSSVAAAATAAAAAEIAAVEGGRADDDTSQGWVKG